MWEVPPIEFVANETAAQLCEVEERLKVADMGPDFEPSTLGHIPKPQPTPREPRTAANALSEGSVVQNLSAFPGPGGSTELVSSRTADDERPETWNTGCEDPSKLCTAEASTDDDDENTVDRNVAESEAYDGIAKDRRCSRSSKHPEADSSSPVSEFRSDVLGLDHARLWQQVLVAKRKSENRSYKPSDELLARFPAESVDGAKNDVTRDMVVTRPRMPRSRKTERQSRDYLLSSHCHNNDEDD